MKNMSNKELCRALDAYAKSFQDLGPKGQPDEKAIRLGINVMKQAKKAIKQYDKAIELLKGFAFFCIDETVKEHGEDAGKVQEFLKQTYAAEWLEEQLALAKCENCEEYDDCENQNGKCGK